jgi:hypothetical protein
MVGGDKNAAAANMAMLWVLNLRMGCIHCSTLPSAQPFHSAVIQGTAQLLKRQEKAAAIARPLQYASRSMVGVKLQWWYARVIFEPITCAGLAWLGLARQNSFPVTS